MSPFEYEMDARILPRARTLSQLAEEIQNAHNAIRALIKEYENEGERLEEYPDTFYLVDALRRLEKAIDDRLDHIENKQRRTD